MKPVIIGGVPRIWDYATSNTELLFGKIGNTGNLAFQYAIQKHVGRNAPVVGWAANPAVVKSKGDIAVIPCANQLGPKTDQTAWATFLEQLETPVVAIGLGAQASSEGELPEIAEGTRRWVRAIAQRGTSGLPNISVRGEFTRRVLERLGYRDEVCVLGCPSLFINDNPKLGKTIAQRLQRTPRRVAVAAGKPNNVGLATLEKQLFALATNSGGSYIVQHPLPFVKAARRECGEIDDKWKVRINNFVGLAESVDEGDSWVPRNMRVFFEPNAWMEELRMHDLVVGTRIHGVALAIQAGVPGLCITHDSRTKELCETMCIPHIDAGRVDLADITLEGVRKYIEFDPQEFDKNRLQIAVRYSSFLTDNGLTSRAMEAFLGASRRNRESEKKRQVFNAV